MGVRLHPHAIERLEEKGEKGVMMKSTYDPKHNIAYFRLQEKTAQVETIHVGESLNVDIAPDGTVYGIELLNADEQLRGRDAGKLIVENVATGTSSEVDLM